ncbi:MAG: dihydroorotate dehydrogenase (quinone) [Oligoflexia bacterium]|nr:dihydroorotate dehydrogenase (quinone) [Oligoflexia bacterium]
MITKPWLFLPSSWLYSLSPLALKFYSHFKSAQPYQWKSVKWRGLSFPNPLGTAGGLDKNALYVQDYWALGAGFVEVGTVTPRAQAPNPYKILDRSVQHLSLWNNMGFPNKGLDFVKKQLELLFEKFNGSQTDKPKLPSPLFVNIGKNRDTPVTQALEDYKKGMEALYPFAEAFVINISSPNTKDLRELFSAQKLPAFLKSLNEIRLGLKVNRPLILKLSPDEEDFTRIIEQSLSAGIDGWCICNSTKQRPIKNLFPEDKGGLSGKLLADTSLKLLKQLNAYLVKNKIEDKLVISCGGVLTAQDVLDRLELGADLAQVYSAVVFKGFGFFESVYKELS